MITKELRRDDWPLPEARPEFKRILESAALLIESQNEAIKELESALEVEQCERIRLENAAHLARAKLEEAAEAIAYSIPARVEFARDHSPHINAMASFGDADYMRGKNAAPHKDAR